MNGNTDNNIDTNMKKLITFITQTLCGWAEMLKKVAFVQKQQNWFWLWVPFLHYFNCVNCTVLFLNDILYLNE